MVGWVGMVHINQLVEIASYLQKATAINAPPATVRLIAVAAGSTVLATRMLEEERVVAFLVKAPAESGA